MTAEFRLSKAELLALCAFASEEPFRPQLSCVAFDFGRGTVTATDGTVLAQYKPAEAPTGTGRVPVPRDILLRMSKLMDRDSVLVVETDEAIVTLKATGPLLNSFWCSTQIPRDRDLAERLPPYWDVIPQASIRAKRTAVISVDPERIAKLARIRNASTRRTAALCIFVPEGSLDAVVCRIDGDARWLAVVMPMRSEETERVPEAAE